MTRKDIERMVQALTDGKLGEREFGQLQDELRANPESREFFRRSMEVEMLLVEAMGQQLAMGGTRGGIEKVLHRRRRRDMTRALLAAVAVLLVAGIVMALVIIRQAEPPTLACVPVPGTQWEVRNESSTAERNPRKVAEGSTVRVRSGSVKLELESGVVMLLRGPAEAVFTKLDQPVLKHGWLWVDSGVSAEPIEVVTPHLRVRDIGTRFGVRVREDGQAETHLVEGRIMVVAKNRQREPLTLKPVGKGFFFSESDRPSELPLADDPFPELPALLASAAGYRTTVLSQGPVGYWRLDTQDRNALTNEIPEGAVGEADDEVAMAEPGARRAEGFTGFPDNNRSIRLTGHPKKSLLRYLDAPGGVSRQEGAVSFWIRRAPGLEHEEILWLAGETSGKAALNPRESIMHTRLSASGRVEFLIENGEYDVLLSSNFSVADGRWHHIAASWGPSAVELYVDGRRVGRVDDFGSLQSHIMQGRYVRFGKPSEDLMDQGKTSFNGWVDEIALWNRPLGGAEVAHQFRAAQGAAGASPRNASNGAFHNESKPD